MSASGDYSSFADHEKIYLENENKKLKAEEHEKNYEEYKGSYQGCIQYLVQAQLFGLFAPFQDAGDEIIAHVRCFKLMEETYVDKMVKRRIRRNENIIKMRVATIPYLQEIEKQVDTIVGHNFNVDVSHKSDAKTWDLKMTDLKKELSDPLLPKKLWIDENEVREREGG